MRIALRRPFAIFLLFALTISSIHTVSASSEPVVSFYPRISNVISWLLSQEVEYNQGQTGYAASLFPSGIDYFRIYTDDNARLTKSLTLALQYYVKEFRDHPLIWDDKIKVSINFVMNGQTQTKDFYHYWRLPNPNGEPTGWQTSEEFYFWNAAVLEGLSFVAVKMRWNKFIGVPGADFPYYDGVKNAVRSCVDRWQPTAQQSDGSWIFTYVTAQGSTRDNQIAENGMILAALVALSYYEQNLGNRDSALKYAGWAQATARWLMSRQERRPDRSWSDGGGYGGLYNNKEDVTQFSAANGRAIFGLAMYGLNIEAIVQQPKPNRADIADLMKAWVDGFVARTHDERWGPIDRVTSAGAHAYPKLTYVAATMGTGTLGAYNFLLDNKSYDWATNFYRWITGANEKYTDFQGCWDRNQRVHGSGFYLGMDEQSPTHPINYDSNIETNLEALQLMISLDDSSLAWNLGQSTTTSTPTTPQGCIIATAAYGSEMTPEVAYMRHVRDDMIGSNKVGRTLVIGWNIFYYSWSPLMAGWIANSEVLQATFRILLIPLISIVHSTAFVYAAIASVNPVFASINAFIFAAILSIVVYIVVPAYAFVTIHKRRVGQLKTDFFS